MGQPEASLPVGFAFHPHGSQLQERTILLDKSIWAPKSKELNKGRHRLAMVVTHGPFTFQLSVPCDSGSKLQPRRIPTHAIELEKS